MCPRPGETAAGTALSYRIASQSSSSGLGMKDMADAHIPPPPANRILSVGKERHVSISSGSSCTVESHNEISVFDESLVEFLGGAIEQVAKTGDAQSSKYILEKDVFIGVQKIPDISIRAYLKRMLKYIDGPELGSESWEQLSLGARSLIFALIYIDRIAQKTNLVINSYRIHRLIAAGMLVALKMNEDDALNMSYFSLLAGIPVNQLNQLEKTFLSKIGFDTFVSEVEFKSRVTVFKLLAARRSRLD